ncbi:MAG TPA: BatA and WFA domain-containing protein [Bacillota bacterium]|nr:BatA and WFA domain-containing protein [Bacillota bacterium]
MSFQNPWGLATVLLIVPIILLYMLRQQYKDIQVASTMLWQEVERQLRAVRPWQRLKTRLLLVLQILAILIFALALARPVYTGTGSGNHYIAVVDASARMQATDIKPSRMGAAKQGLKDLVASMSNMDRMTIIQAGIEPLVVAQETGEKGVLGQNIDSLAAYNSRSDIDKALQLAWVIRGEDEEAQVHLFTDSYNQYDQDIDYHVYNGDGNNLAIVNVSTAPGEDGLVALSRIRNYGADMTVNVELRVDGSLVDIKEVFVAGGDQADLYWGNIPHEGTIIEIAILEDDDLSIDNLGWAVNSDKESVKALLVSERNVFIERAIGLREDVDLVKTNPGQDLSSQNFDLYVYDGHLPDEPPQAHMLIFNPPENAYLDLVEDKTIRPDRVRVNDGSIYSDIVKYIDPTSLHIAVSKKLKLAKGFDALMLDQDDEPLLMVGETDFGRIAVFGFSLHDSNLPVKADFPILIQNIINWMLPPSLSELSNTFSGDSVLLQAMPEVEEITVVSPSGREYTFDAYPEPVFYDTFQVGVYQVTQVSPDKTYRAYFPVSVQSPYVSDLSMERGQMPEELGQGRGRTGTYMKDFWKYAGWALVLLILVEWWVYHHGD